MKKRTLSILLVAVLLVAVVVAAVLLLKPANNGDDPVVEAKPTYTDKLTTETGVVTAYCPVCKADKTWAPYDDTKSELPSVAPTNTDNHFYLTKNLEGTVSSIHCDGPVVTEGIGNACLHLNGYNISNTTGRAIYVSIATDTLNVMGSGNVTGVGTYGVTLYNKGTLNLYSGTYTRETPETSFLCVTNPGSTLNIYDDVVINDPTTLNTIRGEGGGKMNFAGPTINGIVSATAAESISISGNTVIKRLNLKKGLKIDVGTMTTGASVAVNNCVTATDLVFSNAPAAYAVYFKSANAGDAVVPTKDNKLTYSTAAMQWTDETLQKAICPVCNEDVIWYALDNMPGSNSVYLPSNSDNDHFFLKEDIMRANFDGAILTSTDAGGGLGEYCLHLNNHNIDNTGGRGIFMNSTAAMQQDILNVMGGGIVSGKATGQGIVYVRTPKNILNLYGGTYKFNDLTDVTTNNIVVDARGPLTIGDGVTFEKYDAATKNVIKGVTFTVNGGTMKGIWNVMDNKTSSAAATTAGKIVVNAGTFEDYLNIQKQDDDKLVASAEINGGNIAKMTMSNIAPVTVAGNAVIGELDIPANAKITLGELVNGAKITVKASGVFTNTNNKAAAYKDYFAAAASGAKIEVADNALKVS